MSQLDAGHRSARHSRPEAGGVGGAMTAPSTIHIQGQNLAIDNLLLDVGGGQVGVRGTIAEKLNLGVLDQGDAAGDRRTLLRPDLALGGMIDGYRVPSLEHVPRCMLPST